MESGSEGRVLRRGLGGLVHVDFGGVALDVLPSQLARVRAPDRSWTGVVKSWAGVVKSLTGIVTSLTGVVKIP